MPPRQGHKKSRTGCSRCKIRKVKCSEDRPVCLGCQKYPRACVYPTKVTTKKKSPSIALERSGSTSSDTVNGPASPYGDTPMDDISPDRRRALELLLLHHFTYTTAPTFPGYNLPDKARQWMAEAIHIAFEHQFLLNIIFSLSCLHLILEPINRPGVNHEFNFAKMHRLYLNMAVREQRAALSDVNRSNAPALCWASLLMSYIAMRLFPDQTDSEPDAYTVPIQWLSMSGAIASVYVATEPYLRGSTVFDYIQATSGPDFTDRTQVYDYAYTDPFRSIIDFDDGEEIMDEDARAAYDKALAFISKLYQAILLPEPSHQICRRVMALAPLVPRRFLSLTAEYRPRALVIIAYHMSMTKSIEQYWWLQGIGERHVHGIRGMLPSKWLWSMDWPARMLENCINTEYKPGALKK